MHHAIAASHPTRRRPQMRTRNGALSGTEIAILVGIMAALVITTLATRSTTPTDVPTIHVRVEAGETLWSLADEHPVDGLTTEQAVVLIADMNNLDDGTPLHAGRTIRVPSRTAADGVALR